VNRRERASKHARGIPLTAQIHFFPPLGSDGLLIGRAHRGLSSLSNESVRRGGVCKWATLAGVPALPSATKSADSFTLNASSFPPRAGFRKNTFSQQHYTRIQASECTFLRSLRPRMRRRQVRNFTRTFQRIRACQIIFSDVSSWKRNNFHMNWPEFSLDCPRGFSPHQKDSKLELVSLSRARRNQLLVWGPDPDPDWDGVQKGPDPDPDPDPDWDGVQKIPNGFSLGRQIR